MEICIWNSIFERKYGKGGLAQTNIFNLIVIKKPKRIRSNLFYPLVMLFTFCFSSNAQTGKSHESSLPAKIMEGKTDRLADLGMLWGFLKYYHPALAEGRYDWDKELLKILPDVSAAADDRAAYHIMEVWTDQLGSVPACRSCDHIPEVRIKLPPDFGTLFTTGRLPASLVSKLADIRDNYKPPKRHHYIDFEAGAGNPIFQHETVYAGNPYPDTGIRLLALYRYWNMIQYFYPYRHLTGENWNKVLGEFIPRFINADNKEEYHLVCLALAGRIHDSHAAITGRNAILDSVKGSWVMPFRAGFIEDKLVVTGYYQAGKENGKVSIGAIIEQIDGVPVDSLVVRYLPYTPASNYETQLRDMAGLHGFLLRGKQSKTQLLTRDDHGMQEVTVERIPFASVDPAADRKSESPAYKMLPGNIGYIYPGKLSNSDFVKIRDSFSHTKGLIIDLRCYPSTFMPFTYGQWFKGNSSPFAAFTQVSLDRPGSILYSDTVSNGMPNSAYYPGKIIIIVNARTQSQAEYTAMALSTAYRVKILGSTTAGADGNVSEIVFPGGIKTMISGIGVYYPEGTETQRKGLKIDITAKPGISGLRAGKDELLEKAITVIDATP
jgi:hypothetical protein